MKKILLSIALLAIVSGAHADSAEPIVQKREAYNALRTTASNTPVLSLGLLLRNEVGTVSANTTASGCAICNLGTMGPDRVGGGGALTPGNPTSNPNAGNNAGSVLTNVPAGLGVAPGVIGRSASGTGAGWESPKGSEEDRARWQQYEAQYAEQLRQYNLQVTNIINAYMDPNNGKLARARVEVLDAVERDMAAWLVSNPNASGAERANYENGRIAANAGTINALTAQYQQDLAQAKAGFDSMMGYYRQSVENPPETGAGA